MAISYEMKLKEIKTLSLRSGFATVEEALDWYRGCANEVEALRRPNFGRKTMRVFDDFLKEVEDMLPPESVRVFTVRVKTELKGVFSSYDAAFDCKQYWMAKGEKPRLSGRPLADTFCSACGTGSHSSEWKDLDGGDWDRCPHCGMV